MGAISVCMQGYGTMGEVSICVQGSGTIREVSVCILPMRIQAVEPSAKAYMHTGVWNNLNYLYRIVGNHRTVLCGMNMNYEMR